MTEDTEWTDADADIQQALARALAAILGLLPPDDGQEAADPLADAPL
jgi:hypothetical protein